jgi:hypothetical protein
LIFLKIAGVQMYFKDSVFIQKVVWEIGILKIKW